MPIKSHFPLASALIEGVPIDQVRPNPRNARTHSRKQLKAIGASMKAHGFLNPVLVDENYQILAGHGRVEAARAQGISQIPVLRFTHLTDAQKRTYLLADNKIALEAGWDPELLASELAELAELLPREGMDLSLTGFDPGEIDLLMGGFPTSAAPSDDIPALQPNPVSRRGDVWCFGNKHRLLCGDSRDPQSFQKLMNGTAAEVVFCDPPYNLSARAIGGRGTIQHKDFSFAAGEMSSAEFQGFLTDALSNGIAVSAPGAVHYVCMDWRHLDDLYQVARQLYAEMLNLVVWNKTNAGQGSFYRSQHELIGVFRTDDAAHQNNVQLGRFGRNRSNVWTYAGINTFGTDRLVTLASHPTIKPVALIADALLDCSSRGDTVLDQFAGSGTIFLAAEKVGRRAYGIEYEPAFIDVAIHRWLQIHKTDVTLDGDGRTFDEIAADRLAGGLLEPATAAGAKVETPIADKA